MPVALEPLFRLGWSLRRIQRVMVAGYEAMHTIRKGQIRWLPKGCCRSGPIHPADPRHGRLITGLAGLTYGPPRCWRQIRFRAIKCLLSSHIVGSKVKGFGPQVFVCQPRHVDERRLDRWRRGVLGETRYRWPYDSAGGIRPVLKRDPFRAL